MTHAQGPREPAYPPLSHAALPAAVAVLCGLLASCAGAAPSAADRVTAPSASRLCDVLDAATARQVLTAPVPAPRAALDSCSYASADRTSLLTLSSSSRSYDAEVTAARGLAGDPASAGMRVVRSAEVTGLGQAAFSETAEVFQPPQRVALVVWRASSRVWVLTLARPADGRDDAERLVRVARRLDARLPG
ncbi:hypothetical protein IAG44_41265 [Streptomyces roseirectus]|uniref:Lipoprotein n=1 Tax=Streptomyces roseirectus TaxID=2768066 RepID=A0A7H0IQZ3_9ACTN|nr:hypothetical protein [Streptomyces roseirectus]QNP75209.1 hypothetical protein IAG44_41265 [Streptomyces roseirectus]